MHRDNNAESYQNSSREAIQSCPLAAARLVDLRDIPPIGHSRKGERGREKDREKREKSHPSRYRPYSIAESSPSRRGIHPGFVWPGLGSFAVCPPSSLASGGEEGGFVVPLQDIAVL